jgi:hypothetical protein
VVVEPLHAFTDLALGLVTLVLAARLRRTPGVHAHWRSTFWWFGGAALAGALHHGVLVRWPQVADVSWAIISVLVVVAVSYLLAATVVEVLGPGRGRAFWLLRSIGVVAYLVTAAAGHAGIAAILACESLTMASVLVLWSWAAYRGHPLASMMLLAITASGAAAAVKLVSQDVLRPVGLDPTSLYHLAQIAGLVLLYLAVGGAAWAQPSTVASATQSRVT